MDINLNRALLSVRILQKKMSANKLFWTWNTLQLEIVRLPAGIQNERYPAYPTGGSRIFTVIFIVLGLVKFWCASEFLFYYCLKCTLSGGNTNLGKPANAQ